MKSITASGMSSPFCFSANSLEAVSVIRQRNVLVANLASLWDTIGFVLLTSDMFGANSKHTVFKKFVAMALESFYVGTIGEALHKSHCSRRSAGW